MSLNDVFNYPVRAGNTPEPDLDVFNYPVRAGNTPEPDLGNAVVSTFVRTLSGHVTPLLLQCLPLPVYVLPVYSLSSVR